MVEGYGAGFSGFSGFRVALQGVGFRVQGSMGRRVSGAGFDRPVDEGVRPRWVAASWGWKCRTNMAHVRQTTPDSGLGFLVTKVLNTFLVDPSSLESGRVWGLTVPSAKVCEGVLVTARDFGITRLNTWFPLGPLGYE